MPRVTACTLVTLGLATAACGDARPGAPALSGRVGTGVAAPATNASRPPPLDPEPSDDSFCRWFVPAPTVERARVRVTTPLFADDEGCPDVTPRCERGALRAADEVAIVDRLGPFACVTRGDVDGWVATTALEPLAARPSRPWVGSWSAGNDRITIAMAAGGDYRVHGEAEWHGSGDNVHVGQFDGRGAPDRRGTMRVAESPCEVRLQLVGSILLVEDNADCGGVNVRFLGAFVASTAR
ncbi:MAG: hypothetical protein U0414_18665 [Polyangiaceae bacterium]